MDEMLKLIGAGGIGALILAGILALIWFLLRSTLQAKLDVMKGREIESIKSEFTQKLQDAKHQLELEHSRLAIVYEYQKDAFSQIIRAMHEGEAAVSDLYDPDADCKFLDGKEIEKFRKLVSEQSLYLDSECDAALALFAHIMDDALPTEVGLKLQSPDHGIVLRTLDWMGCISTRVREHFRIRIGLRETTHPLRDVTILAACKLINNFSLRSAGFPTQSVLRIVENMSAAELVHVATKNRKVLLEELTRFANALRKDAGDKRFFYEHLTKAESYIRQIQICND